MGSRLTFCVAIREIQKVKGYFFGGQVINILEASTIEEYHRREEAERKYFEWLAEHPPVDSTAHADSLIADADSAIHEAEPVAKKTDSVVKKVEKKPIAPPPGDSKDFLRIAAEEEDVAKNKTDVVDRKYYEGKFDDEIPVKLYVRYMRAAGSNKPVTYDGLYKFGDQLKYVKLDIIVQPDGKWLMEDDVPVGILELELKNKEFIGVWTNNDENGYDARLKEMPLSQKRMETYEAILDRGLSGRVDEKAIEKEEGKESAETEKSKDNRDKPAGANTTKPGDEKKPAANEKDKIPASNEKPGTEKKKDSKKKSAKRREKD
jgi:hypothetical protein